ncbi:sulfurtransferase TusA family protein [Clostridium sp.]|uniref:sulfurtransferase TusA family protein n=1 Tax=Clostridium sp. TaxID=1506 RepID=UPI001A457CE6|nr:sulfurtransferase TusA family protein [Clostridium sp.]MBK5241979.1 sulfurtransferase TusA family protein [Clostridium sp.]
MNTIDCLGDMCPIPVLKIKKALKKAKTNDSIKVITDHSCVAESIKNHFTRKDLQLEFDEVMNGIWEIIITKL